ncbi:low temperature requirement protein A [Novosphingobium aquimarinum]|uniref:low temperature requirement protein A n=1 Tax=Novosphingobium aquimarinum TaxID=2682494 RepID=UPI0012EC9AA8|nr:low temperature requirement protein A [Novosphingobium aquimarinum]
MSAASNELLHERDGDEVPVGFSELFFDLVFVFAITQVSHTILEHFSVLGLVQSFIVLLALWWSWICTTWVTNWLDAEKATVRLLLFGLMALGLLLASAVPDAFAERGLYFAMAYVGFQLGRTAFVFWASKGHAELRANFIRAGTWFATVGIVWIAGGIAAPEDRIWIWGLAMMLDLLAAAVRFWLPVLGATPFSHWDIEGGHIAHRCGLFMIIVLGEAVLLIGGGFAENVWTVELEVCFLACVAVIVAMWWIYFGEPGGIAQHRVASHPRSVLLALTAYTYLPVLFVSGAVLTAVGSELVLEDPAVIPHGLEKAVLIAGPALFLIAAVIVARLIFGKWKPLRIAAALTMVALVPLPTSALATSLSIALIVTLLAILEYLQWRRLDDEDKARLRGDPHRI